MPRYQQQVRNPANGYSRHHTDQRNGFSERIITSGGTFDTLHAGHKEYLRLAFEYGDRILLYVTSDGFIKAKKRYKVRSYTIRVKSLQDYIDKIPKSKDRYEIRQLNSLAQLKNDLLNEDVFIALVVPEYYSIFRRINRNKLEKLNRIMLLLVKERTRERNNYDLSSTALRFRHI